MGLFTNIFKMQKNITVTTEPVTKTQSVQKITSNPKDNNARFSELSKTSAKHMRQGKIGLYRCDLFSMAQIIEKEGKLKNALKQYLYVFYLDSTGIDDLAAIEMIKDGILKPRPIVAPAVIKRIRIIKNKLELSDVDFKDLYFLCPEESIMPYAVFSYADSFDLLLTCLNDGADACEEVIRKAVKNYKFQ